MKNLKTLALIACAALVPELASAVSVIDAGVTTQIADTQTDIVTVGGAIIGLAVVAMGVRWSCCVCRSSNQW